MEAFEVYAADLQEHKPSKVEILRGLVIEKLTIAVQEILLVVETTIAGYDKEALLLKRELNHHKRQLDAILLPQVRLFRVEGNNDDRGAPTEVSNEEAREKNDLIEHPVKGEQEEQASGKQHEPIHKDKQEDECFSDCAALSKDGEDNNDLSPAENHEKKEENEEPNAAPNSQLLINTETLNCKDNEISTPMQRHHLDDPEVPKRELNPHKRQLDANLQPQVILRREEGNNNDKEEPTEESYDDAMKQDKEDCISEDFSDSCEPCPAIDERPKDEGDPGNDGERVLRKRRRRSKNNATNSGTDDDGERDGEWKPNVKNNRQSSNVKKRTRIKRKSTKAATGERQGSHETKHRDDEGDEADEDGQSEGNPSPTENDEEPSAAPRSKIRRNGTLNCKVCGLPFNSKAILTKHALHFHLENPEVLCGVCGQHQETPEQLKTHVEAHEKLHQCEECGRYFRSWYHLLKHNAVCQTGRRANPKKTQLQKSFQCDRCPKAYSFESYLQMHYIKHTGEKRFCCEVCGKCFKTFQDYSLHISTHTGTKTLSCQECGKSFSHIRYLRKHKKIHSERKCPHLCEFCSKAFPTKGQLKAHVTRIHEEMPLVKCPVCHKELKGQLQLHMKIHTGEKPYACSECGMRFRKYSTHKNHMDIHRGVKRFSCSVCEYKCFRKEHLNVHMSTHTGEKPYKCSECDMAFTQSHCLKSHMKKQH